MFLNYFFANNISSDFNPPLMQSNAYGIEVQLVDQHRWPV